ncbi:hypothetical protein [Kitasatospora sp. NBC_01266]|uniref:hypothetical protein n=1 Tax=Kitasatospora sp. NBC_01266 TaxID=2903572 RepID=UPI002E37B374|nr:hypothetical protein [Kitasatospora sp. NBC_01266]
MTAQRTPLPLTDTERAELQRLITEASKRLQPRDRNRLLWLAEHDRRDREQERRSAGGLAHRLRALQQQTRNPTTITT